MQKEILESQYCMQIYLLKLSCFIFICLVIGIQLIVIFREHPCVDQKRKVWSANDLIRWQNADSRECNLLIFQTEQEIQATFTITEIEKRKYDFFEFWIMKRNESFDVTWNPLKTYSQPSLRTEKWILF